VRNPPVFDGTIKEQAMLFATEEVVTEEDILFEEPIAPWAEANADDDDDDDDWDLDGDDDELEELGDWGDEDDSKDKDDEW
jgi:hypothetical protein